MSRGWFYVCNHAWHTVTGLAQLVAMSPIGAARRARERRAMTRSSCHTIAANAQPVAMSPIGGAR